MMWFHKKSFQLRQELLWLSWSITYNPFFSNFSDWPMRVRITYYYGILWEGDNKILIVQRVYNWTRVMFKGSKQAFLPFLLSFFLRLKSWRSNTIAAHNIMSVRKTWVYKIPQSKTKPKDENVRISSVHYCARGSHLEGHLWVILKFAQNVTSSNQNHHYRAKWCDNKGLFWVLCDNVFGVVCCQETVCCGCGENYFLE